LGFHGGFYIERIIVNGKWLIATQISVVTLATANMKGAILEFIDEAMFLVYAPGPPAGEVFAEGFDLTSATERVNPYFFKKGFDFIDFILLVLLVPRDEVVFGFNRELIPLVG